MRVIQLNNSANWELLYSYNTVATQAPLQNGSYIHTPIPDIEIPVILDNFIIAVSVETNVPTNSEWHFAGYVKQKISTGLVVGGNQDATRVKSQPLFLDQINLILFEKISTNYSISIQIPKWFLNADVIIWEYIGIDTTDEKQLLDQILINTSP